MVKQPGTIQMKFTDGLKFLDELKDYVQNVHQTVIVRKEIVENIKIEENAEEVKASENEDFQKVDVKKYFENDEQSDDGEQMENPLLVRENLEVTMKEEDTAEIDLLDFIKQEMSEYGEINKGWREVGHIYWYMIWYGSLY